MFGVWEHFSDELSQPDQFEYQLTLFPGNSPTTGIEPGHILTWRARNVQHILNVHHIFGSGSKTLWSNQGNIAHFYRIWISRRDNTIGGRISFKVYVFGGRDAQHF